MTTLLTLLAAAVGKDDDAPQLARTHLERLFVYCCVWALGGLLGSEDRVRFDARLRPLAEGTLLPRSDGERTMYDYFVADSAEWQLWETRVPEWRYPVGVERPKYASLVIPTVDSVRYERLLGMVASVGGATLLVGGPGTAKTTIVAQYMAKLNTDTYTYKSITFSSLTTPNIFQFAIEGAVEKRQGRTYGPAGGKKMAVFIDDISMPDFNDWGDQVTNEAVRQLLETGALYQLEKPIGDQKSIVDCLYIAAMNTPGGGKNDIPNRLKRHFACFNVPLPSGASISSVFGTLVAGRFDAATFSPEVVAASAKLVPATVVLWNRVQAKMLPTPAKFHYLFNSAPLAAAAAAAWRRQAGPHAGLTRARRSAGAVQGVPGRHPGQPRPVPRGRALPALQRRHHLAGGLPGGAVAARVRARVLRQADQHGGQVLD